MKIHFEDAEFEALIPADASIEPVALGYTWTEGPVWWHGALYFNDIPSKRMLRWREGESVRTVLDDTDFANGNTTDLAGRMVSCEHGGRRVIVRDDPQNPAAVRVLAERVDGNRLNSPNDVVVASDGGIWFTDPPYGIDSDAEGYPADSEIGSNDVYRIDPDGSIARVASDFDKPNGLAFSPDESLLYIADSGATVGASVPGFDYDRPHHIRVFDVVGNRLQGGRVFATIKPGVPDGFRIDVDGRVWTSSADGIHCLRPDGRRIGRIELPDTTANCCFGGDDGTDLFITSSGSVYRVRTRVRGAESLRGGDARAPGDTRASS